jgi:hypothetical protein
MQFQFAFYLYASLHDICSRPLYYRLLNDFVCVEGISPIPRRLPLLLNATLPSYLYGKQESHQSVKNTCKNAG